MKKFKKFREYEDGEDLYESRDRRQRLNEKRLRSALSQCDVEELLQIQDDEL